MASLSSVAVITASSDFVLSAAAAAYTVMSAVAFGLYWADKRRAHRGEWRISEATLHGVELLGGWPGAWLGQRVFRHKWRKTRYVLVFWTIVAVHALGWAWWLGLFE